MPLRSPALPVLAALLLAACGQQAPAPATDASTPLPTASIPADPAQAVLQASQRFAALRSFHAQMTLHGAQKGQVVSTSMDFVAPDRYRLRGAAGVQTIIGNTVFLASEGGTQQLPLPAGLLDQWRTPLPPAAELQGLAVEDRGPADVGGTATRLYRVDGPQGSGETLQYWIGDDGLPRQVQRDGFNGDQPYRVTLRYSQLNDPDLQIAVP